MIELALSKGLVALIDDEDARLAEYKWFADVRETVTYATRNSRKSDGGRGRQIRLHRAVLNAPEGFEVDHVNGNGLDCRRSNLRLATKAQNQRNRRMRKDGFKGVSWHKGRQRWRADIRVNGHQKSLGTFSTQEEAARAYDAAASEAYGEFARLNFAA